MFSYFLDNHRFIRKHSFMRTVGIPRSIPAVSLLMLLAFGFASGLSAAPADGADCVSYAACESRIRELHQAGKSASALALFESAPDQQKVVAESSDAALLKARLLLDRDRLREAGMIYEDQCRSVRTHSCWNALGVVRMVSGGHADAIAAFEEALTIQKSARTYSNLAVAYAHMNQPDHARENHDRALALEPENPTVQMNFGVFLFTGRRFADAGAIFKNVLNRNPDLFYARLYMGRVLTMQREYNAALLEFDRGIQLNPNFFDLYYHRAVVRAKLGDPGGALSDLNQADRINPISGLTDPLREAIKRKKK